MRAENRCDLFAAQLPHRGFEHERFQFFVCERDVLPIGQQEHDGRDGADTFIAVIERMVLNEMEQVGCGHLKQVG